MHRETGEQLGFSDGFLRDGLGRNVRLERIDGLLDWARLGAVVAGVHGAATGAPSYPPLTMVKALLLQAWYGLSDPGLEEALLDRLSFRRFVGLGLDDGTPDYSTISRFRKHLREAGLSEALFEEVNRQLDERGLFVKQGVLLDASIIEAQGAKPAYGSASDDAADKDARWTRKGGKSYYGYKAHIGVDRGSRLIRRNRLTPASLNDTECADGLIPDDVREVYADMAYDTHARRGRLKVQGVKDRVMHRPNKHHPTLPRWKARRNDLIAPIRAAVEAVFGTLKRSYRYTKVRYMSLDANAAHLNLLCIAINLRRAEVLTR